MGRDIIYTALEIALVVCIGSGLGHAPGCAVVALGLILFARLTEGYFKELVKNDVAEMHIERQMIDTLKADFAKLKAKQDQADIKAAFGKIG